MVGQQRFKGLVIVLFFIVVIVLYILIYFVPNIGDTFQKTQIAVYDSIQVKDVLECYVVRDETVFFSDQEGKIKYHVSEGERVKKNSTVISIDTQNMGTNKKSDVAEINARISVINSGENVLKNDLKNIQEITENIIDEIIVEKEQGNIAKVRELSERFNKIIEKRAILLENRRLELLSEQEERTSNRIIESILHSNVDSYKSANPGIISYYIDGYETEFSSATMYLLKKDEMGKIDGEVESISREYALDKEPVFKIVNAHEWYTVSWVDNSRLKKLRSRNEIIFNLPEGKIKGKVHDIMEDDTSSLVIIRIDEHYPKFWEIRKMQVQVVALNYEGLKINNESIVTVDGKTGVFVTDLDGNFVFTPVEIVGANSKYTIVESGYFYEKTNEGSIKIDTIDLYDEILRNGKSKLENRSNSI